MKFAHAAVAALAALAGGQALACYTVYDRDNRIVYNAQTPPVDMSRPLHETLPKAFPGGHMVFAHGSECPTDVARPPVRVGLKPGSSPLLTDAKTAASLGLPHTPLGNGIVVVPNRPDNMRPGVVLAESDPQYARSSNTATMGAGPARSPQRTGPVITETPNRK
jgi:hypothetical protein